MDPKDVMDITTALVDKMKPTVQTSPVDLTRFVSCGTLIMCFD